MLPAPINAAMVVMLALVPVTPLQPGRSNCQNLIVWYDAKHLWCTPRLTN